MLLDVSVFLLEVSHRAESVVSILPFDTGCRRREADTTTSELKVSHFLRDWARSPTQ